MKIIHDSDCAVHNEPAYPNGPCDCGAEMVEALEATNDNLRHELRECASKLSLQKYGYKQALHANDFLVDALDRIHDVLNGVYVDDIALIVNRALAANKELLK